MPRADEYAGAVETLVDDLDLYRESPELVASYTLAARCVRAMAALASGEVRLLVEHAPIATDLDRRTFTAWRPGKPLPACSDHDPLDAITAALGGDDGPR